MLNMLIKIFATFHAQMIIAIIAVQSFDIKKHLRICTNDMLGSFGEVSIKKVLTKLGINFRFDISYELMGDE
jgi:hypothetical protein